MAKFCAPSTRPLLSRRQRSTTAPVRSRAVRSRISSYGRKAICRKQVRFESSENWVQMFEVFPVSEILVRRRTFGKADRATRSREPYFTAEGGKSVTGQRSNRTQRQSAIRVIEGLSRDLEKTGHNPFAIGSADKFRCCRAAKTRGVTSTISASEWPHLCLRSVTQVFSALFDRPQWTE
jgi:hypothetical protein